MNATNRLLSRLMLAMTGLILLAVCAVSVVFGDRAPWADQLGGPVIRTLEDLAGWRVLLGSGEVPAVLLATPVVAVVVVLAVVLFLRTQRSGGVSQILEANVPGGSTLVATNVAEAVLAETLSERPDVLDARIAAHHGRGGVGITLTVNPHRSADLVELSGAVNDAVAQWDRLLGTTVPIVVHLTRRRRLPWRNRGSVVA